MKEAWLEGYLLNKPGVEKEYKPDWGATLYKVGGKFFALLGDGGASRESVSLKLEPEMGEELRREFEGKVVAGYHLNKGHWNTVYLGTDVPEGVIRMMVDESYRLVFAGLSKKLQGEIEGGEK